MESDEHLDEASTFNLRRQLHTKNSFRDDRQEYGETCKEGSDCFSGVCGDGKCTCLTDEDCAGTLLQQKVNRSMSSSRVAF